MASHNQPRWAMVIEADKCIDCKACDVACKRENQIDAKGNPEVCRNWINNEGVKGTYPNLQQTFTPEQCHQCDNPPCVPVCPVQATWQGDDGVVLVDKKKCIGCTLCAINCPYKARYMTEARKGETRKADKCNYCEYRPKTKLPACVDTCPTKVRTFGNLNDPNSDVSKLLKDRPYKVLQEDKGTKPHIFYI
ncbi:4Fe-4S dicluster domain-containing protein [Desulfurispira natronophila]|uniref:Fe-S-cluster-containing dehydrogenase component n=1 Tax=Desulfurispira natronophila TaxID=682562 RepID=A0A7W7Y2E6_9BACT|nr:4Fe-4S dicluster domain-containing protein [Desulfurispira natronophila]MBB5020812.1 Fe-S-cluster-containing dehydrogenase component [Desulfurispira natronophila]